jgi:hypothetical protein
MKKFSALLIFLISTPLLAEEIPGKTLLSYFYGSCKTSSQWTQAALADSEALIKTLDAMKNDVDCATAAGAISQLSSLGSQLATLEKLNTSKNNIALYDAEEQELLIQLTKTTNTAALYEINSQLRNVQVQRAKLLNSDKSAEKLSGADKASVLGKIAESANASFAQITANERCLEKNPSLLNSATSIMAGVGSAVTLVNPAIGLSMTAGSTFAKVAMDGIRSSRQSREIRNIADSTITFEAYSCALETMSERWCQMKDAMAFLKFKAENRKANLNKGLAQAITLNDREIPVILDWLTKIRNGVDPRTTADAERRSEVLTRELIVRAQSDYALALLEQKRNAYLALAGKPDDQQWIFLRSLIMSIAPQETSMLTTTTTKNPMNDIYTQMFAPYYLIGLKDNDPRIRNATGIYLLSSWQKPPELQITLDEVKARYKQWVVRATDLVNRELTEVQQPDPLQTLSSANIEAEPWMITPLDALKSVEEFLSQNPPLSRQNEFKKLYVDTIDKIKRIHDLATSAVLIGEFFRPLDETTKLSPIEEIYDIAQLKFGIVVLQARLEMIIRLSLLEYIKNSPEEEQVLVAQLLASDRFFETIGRMNGTSDIGTLTEGIKKGKAYTTKNLSNFMEIFGGNINRTLRDLYQQELRSSPTVAKENRDLRTSMCFLLLGAENVDKYIELSLCKGLKMTAIERGGPESVTIDESSFTKDLSDRACTHREFFRQSYIYQKWRIKN